MNKKVLNIIKITIIVFIIASFITSFIVSQDEHHLETCHEDHCVYCTIIQIAQNIISLIIAFITVIILGFLINFFLSRLHRRQTSFVLISLVSQKVQLNE